MLWNVDIRSPSASSWRDFGPLCVPLPDFGRRDSRFFLSRRRHYVQYFHFRCPSHVGCTDLKLVSGNMSDAFSLASCALAGSLQDQLRDFIRLRDEGQVTRFNLYGLGAHPLGHEALEVRIDRAVLGRNGVIARL